MGIAEQERRRHELYRRVLPSIVAGLRERAEPVALAEQLAGVSETVDQWEVYRWIQSTESAIESYRRRRAVVMLIPVWIGGALIVAGGLMLMTGGAAERSGYPTAIVAAGVLLVAVFLYAAVHCNRRAHTRWLQREEHSDE